MKRISCIAKMMVVVLLAVAVAVPCMGQKTKVTKKTKTENVTPKPKPKPKPKPTPKPKPKPKTRTQSQAQAQAKPQIPVLTGISTELEVDLGLSVKWAGRNVGASTPEEYGGLYGWGDVTGARISTDYGDYPSADPPASIGGDSRYDISRALWGGTWRLPSQAEIKELVSSCTWQWGTYRGVKGYKVTGPSGNAIFLPAVGLRNGSDVSSRGSAGYYWSGELNAERSGYAYHDCAYNLYFTDDSHYSNYSGRLCGQAVRPVVGKDEINGHYFVDLGLSVKWATCNVGASSPEEYGGLYGWADASGTKTSTDKDDYPNGNPPSNISGDIRYDIARAKWGSTWRLPTKAEIDELNDRCKWQWTTRLGVNGYEVTGPNGKSIFLPAAGGRDGTYVFGRSNGGHYWSSESATFVWSYSLYFTSGEHDIVSYYKRYRGHSVRAVTE